MRARHMLRQNVVLFLFFILAQRSGKTTGTFNLDARIYHASTNRLNLLFGSASDVVGFHLRTQTS